VERQENEGHLAGYERDHPIHRKLDALEIPQQAASAARFLTTYDAAVALIEEHPRLDFHLRFSSVNETETIVESSEWEEAGNPPLGVEEHLGERWRKKLLSRRVVICEFAGAVEGSAFRVDRTRLIALAATSPTRPGSVEIAQTVFSLGDNPNEVAALSDIFYFDSEGAIVRSVPLFCVSKDRSLDAIMDEAVPQHPFVFVAPGSFFDQRIAGSLRPLKNATRPFARLWVRDRAIPNGEVTDVIASSDWTMQFSMVLPADSSTPPSRATLDFVHEMEEFRMENTYDSQGAFPLMKTSLMSFTNTGQDENLEFERHTLHRWLRHADFFDWTEPTEGAEDVWKGTGELRLEPGTIVLYPFRQGRGRRLYRVVEPMPIDPGSFDPEEFEFALKNARALVVERNPTTRVEEHRAAAAKFRTSTRTIPEWVAQLPGYGRTEDLLPRQLQRRRD
jgi:hypothetical protein